MERPKKASRKTSSMWYYFEPVNDECASCNICLKTLRYKSSTSNLKKHLRQKHTDTFVNVANTAVDHVERIGLEGDDDNDNEENDNVEEEEGGSNELELAVEGLVNSEQADDDVQEVPYKKANNQNSLGKHKSEPALLAKTAQNSAKRGETLGSARHLKIQNTFSMKNIQHLPAMIRQQKGQVSCQSQSQRRADGEGEEDTEDEFTLFGRHITHQLQRLSNVNAFLAQEEIQSVLTRYRVYELSTESKSKMLVCKK